jgi:GAF domain-containing protein
VADRRHDALVARGDDREPLTLDAVDRRRTSLWIVAGLFILVASLAVAIAMTGGGEVALAGSPAIRWALLALAVGFLLYVIEQERVLRRMTRALLRAEVLAASLRARIRDLTTLSRVGRLVNSVLTMDDVLELLLDAVTQLTSGTRASVLFLDGEELEVVAGHGDDLPPRGSRVPVGDGVAGWVAANREPVLVNGKLAPHQFPGHHERDDPGSSVVAPLLVDGETIGVLAVERPADAEPFTEVEMRSIAIFGDQAATAVMNARRYEEERARVERLADALERRGELVAMLVHELKTPLTSILGMSQILTDRADRVTDDRRVHMVRTVREQASKLRDMIDELLRVASADAGADLARERVELAELVRSGIEAAQALAQVQEDGPRPVHVELPDELPDIWGTPRRCAACSRTCARTRSSTPRRGARWTSSSGRSTARCTCRSSTAGSGSRRRTRRTCSSASDGPPTVAAEASASASTSSGRS